MLRRDNIIYFIIFTINSKKKDIRLASVVSTN